MVDNVCHFTEGIISRRDYDGKERERETEGKGCSGVTRNAFEL